WGLGDVNEALKCLEVAEQQARAHRDDVYSLWRLRNVSNQQYLDDCALTRRMFQGEPFRPSYLGRSSTTTAVSSRLTEGSEMNSKITPFSQIVEKIVACANAISETMERVGQFDKNRAKKNNRLLKLGNNARDLSQKLQHAQINGNEVEAAEALRGAQKRWIQTISQNDVEKQMQNDLTNMKKLVHVALETFEGRASYFIEEKNGALTL